MRHKPECCKWEPGPGWWGQGSVSAALVPKGPSAGKDQQHSISGKFIPAKMCSCPPLYIWVQPYKKFLFLEARLTEAFLPFSLDLVLYCEAFLTTYRTFITPEELIKKLQYRYPFTSDSSLPPGITTGQLLWRELVASFLVKSLLAAWSVMCWP